MESIKVKHKSKKTRWGGLLESVSFLSVRLFIRICVGLWSLFIVLGLMMMLVGKDNISFFK